MGDAIDADDAAVVGATPLARIVIVIIAVRCFVGAFVVVFAGVIGVGVVFAGLARFHVHYNLVGCLVLGGVGYGERNLKRSWRVKRYIGGAVIVVVNWVVIGIPIIGVFGAIIEFVDGIRHTTIAQALKFDCFALVDFYRFQAGSEYDSLQAVAASKTPGSMLSPLTSIKIRFRLAVATRRSHDRLKL